MAKNTCSIDGCDEPCAGRGWCMRHYNIWRNHGDPETVVAEKPTLDNPRYAVVLEARYRASFAEGPEDECWPWTGKTNNKGYGTISIRHKWSSATQYGWSLRFGPSGGLFVCHTCDNPPCQNPAHWFLGTQAQNLADMGAKGRAPSQQPGLARVCLNPDKVRAVRLAHTAGHTTRELADRYGVSTEVIRTAVKRLTWAWVE